MAKYTVTVAESHYTSYVVEADSPKQAQQEVSERGILEDERVEFSFVLETDYKVYDEGGLLVYLAGDGEAIVDSDGCILAEYGCDDD